MKRIVVTGGRFYDDFATVSDALDALAPTEIFHGDCTGADTLADQWARMAKVPVRKFPYPSNLGRAGGPVRNGQMLREAGPDAILVAFAGQAGTANCVKQAVALNMLVLRVEP